MAASARGPLGTRLDIPSRIRHDPGDAHGRRPDAGLWPVTTT